MIAVTETAGGVRFSIRVMPRASKDAVGGERDGRLVVRVTAPPVDDAANHATVAALAKGLGLPASRIAIVVGQTARNKTIQISGVNADTVRAAIARLSGT